ncbi:nitrate reductase subunit alpha [Sphingomonas sp. MAH-20]|uniref:nitrate reductase (quinone) n=1 Tax=Sphingomonas horti TaxID=2682842 RepID=A0A6I4J090_9SPHN|nr:MULTISPECIES: nitrate reductase subunit alpha [Sphingomonas]MBA2919963.1 nitrate reductase subunit alpha [Sphingomonas sp. CGMCC 1.13658]MVO77845.1 nitrate reductase subunit alpha [Sphingomonas horti]
MSHFLDRLTYFRRQRDKFADGHGITTNESREWEDAYRKRWAADKIVRSTHGVNCTGSCSWKIYVKGGIVTWETQQTDYPRTRPDLPNHEPRGCPRGASYSWYLYSGTRIKYPLVRARLIRHWREARKTMAPVAAWKSIVQDTEKRRDWVSKRGRGGFVRVGWDEATEIIAAANAYTIKQYGPDRIAGFSPIPAMSMISYAAGSRYLSLIGGNLLSFYDWYCDLPPSSPQTWGEQTDVPESADWYNAGFLLVWGSNIPMTRAPDAHFYSEVRYRGAKSVVIAPDYNEAAKFSDMWLHPKQGTDAALALALGHVVLREFFVDRQAQYFADYTRQYSDFPLLVKLVERDGRLVADRMLRAADVPGTLSEANNPDWKTVAFDELSGELVAPLGSVGFRWGEQGKWNLEERDGAGKTVRLRTTLAGQHDAIVPVAFPYFGTTAPHDFTATDHDEVLLRNVPVKTLELADGTTAQVATVFDLFCANYGVDRGFGGENVAKSYDEDVPFTPAWAEKVTGVPRQAIIQVAREFADTAEKTKGRSMVILGAGLNHWYHMDMSYRGIIALLVMCGCIGQSGGGWSHYVGQEKLRPQTGWLPLAFALDWTRPPRQMNGTSFFYAHTDQWRYETLKISEIISPLAPDGDWSGSMIDYNAKAERMGWLPSAPQMESNPIELGRHIKETGADPASVVVDGIKAGNLKPASLDPDNPVNWPRNMFFWRSNVLGASGKGHEYFLKHLVGSLHGVIGTDEEGAGIDRPKDVVWRDEAPVGKLDLMVNIDFRMSTTSVYSDVVLPTATWYEKHDLNTSDMHPFIHPLSAAVDPAWEAQSDWNIFRAIAKKFSDVAPEVLGVEHDLVMSPILHDTPGELAQPYEPKDWLKGECEPIPGKTMPNVTLVERNYPETFARFTSMGPMLEATGNGAKGMMWDAKHEIELLGDLNGRVLDGPTAGRPKIDTDIDACETILMLAPETNGEVALKAWEALGKTTGRDHAHLAEGKEEEKIRFRDVAAQPRKIISSPIWSGLESEKVCYNAGYTNVHELIPWRTLSGRQALYQDHHWMRAFGEGFVTWRPPIDTKTVRQVLGKLPNGNPEIMLNFLTPHQKWGIHSTYTENLIMLSLNRGGPMFWISEDDAKAAGIEDNDWIEAFNVNGALTARAIVSQRIRPGSAIMYHAQEKLVNTVGSEITGQRGGIHNSVTRINMKPTHMIGGYAQLAYGFNYYGTVGANRDEWVVVRKMSQINWFDKTADDAANVEGGTADWGTGTPAQRAARKEVAR